MVKAEYFGDVDIMNIYWGKKKGVESSMDLKNVNCLIDFNKDGEMVGIEIWDFKKAFEESQKRIDRIFKIADKHKTSPKHRNTEGKK